MAGPSSGSTHVRKKKQLRKSCRFFSKRGIPTIKHVVNRQKDKGPFTFLVKPHYSMFLVFKAKAENEWGITKVVKLKVAINKLVSIIKEN